MTQTDRPSVADMNRTIGLYEAVKYWPRSSNLFVKYSDAYELENNGVRVAFGPEQLKYHDDWNWIHRSWNKLYMKYSSHEMSVDAARIFYREYGSPMQYNMYIGNITTAHRILFEAVEWYNNQNK